MKHILSNLLIALAFLLMLPGCYTQQKAARQMDKARSTYPAVTANRCADWYPIQRFDSVIREYIPGKPGPVQYVRVDCDTVEIAVPGQSSPARPAGTRIVTIPCPPCPGVDTLKEWRFRVEEQTARISELQTRVADAELKANTATTKLAGARRWNWILAVAAGLLAAAHIFLFARKFKI